MTPALRLAAKPHGGAIVESMEIEQLIGVDEDAPGRAATSTRTHSVTPCTLRADTKNAPSVNTPANSTFLSELGADGNTSTTPCQLRTKVCETAKVHPSGLSLQGAWLDSQYCALGLMLLRCRNSAVKLPHAESLRA